MTKPTCIIHCGSDKTPDIVRIAADSGRKTVLWHLYYPTIDFKLDITETYDKPILIQIENGNIKTSQFNKEFTEKYANIIFSGGGILKEIQNDIKEFFDYLKHIEIPVLGICFGHQIIGLVYGAELYNIENKISGKFPVQFVESYDIVRDISTADFTKNHQEAITLPNDYTLIAKSTTCKNEMMKHINKNIYGVQFHPEVSGGIGVGLVLSFLGLL